MPKLTTKYLNTERVLIYEEEYAHALHFWDISLYTNLFFGPLLV